MEKTSSVSFGPIPHTIVQCCADSEKKIVDEITCEQEFALVGSGMSLHRICANRC